VPKPPLLVKWCGHASVFQMSFWYHKSSKTISFSKQYEVRVRVMVLIEHNFQQYLSYIVDISFIGGGKRSTQCKPPNCRRSLTKLYHIMLYQVHPRHERDSSSQLLWWLTLITYVVANPTTIQSWPWRPLKAVWNIDKYTSTIIALLNNKMVIRYII
jgi:hypothetical protein